MVINRPTKIKMVEMEKLDIRVPNYGWGAICINEARRTENKKHTCIFGGRREHKNSYDWQCSFYFVTIIARLSNHHPAKGEKLILR